MMKPWSWIASVVVVAAVAGTSLANIPPPVKPEPPPQPPTQAPINIAIDETIKEPVLRVPKKVLANLRADAGEADPNTGRAQGVPNLNVIIAGSALAVALALGGLWLVRGRKKPGSTALLMLIAVAGVVGVASVASADLSLPKPKPNPAPVPGVPLADAKVKIEVVEEGDTIVLVVKKEHLTKVLDAAAKDAPKEQPKK